MSTKNLQTSILSQIHTHVCGKADISAEEGVNHTLATHLPIWILNRLLIYKNDNSLSGSLSSREIDFPTTDSQMISLIKNEQVRNI